MMLDVRENFGDIDIYLFDQIQKNRFPRGSKILDAGCGGGRNLKYFLRNGFEVFGIDQNKTAIDQAARLANELAPDLPTSNFQMAGIESTPFEDGDFDAVICSAVLHFAAHEAQFRAMFMEIWRVLASGGLLFSRLASTIGIEDKIVQIVGRRYSLPDGSERFLVDEEMLVSLTEEVGGTFLEPIKTTNVQNLRCMTTWVLRKN